MTTTEPAPLDRRGLLPRVMGRPTTFEPMATVTKPRPKHPVDPGRSAAVQIELTEVGVAEKGDLGTWVCTPILIPASSTEAAVEQVDLIGQAFEQAGRWVRWDPDLSNDRNLYGRVYAPPGAGAEPWKVLIGTINVAVRHVQPAGEAVKQALGWLDAGCDWSRWAKNPETMPLDQRFNSGLAADLERLG